MPQKRVKKSFNQVHRVNIDKVHLVRRELTEVLYYPPHPPRKNSKLYTETHERLIYQDNAPCYICGVEERDIKRDGKGELTTYNPVGSKQLETHHDIIEWASANGINWDKVAKDYPELNSLRLIAKAWDLEHGHGHPIKGKIHYTEMDYSEFVDSADNILVLCDIHHRGPYYGIHAITYPIWVLQRYQTKDFQFLPRHLEKAKEG